MTRIQIVLDVESNGLDPEQHEVVELAWWNLTTDARAVFVPMHNQRMVLHDADIRALQVNRYIDRIADRMDFKQGTCSYLEELSNQLEGSTIIGSNPAFDAAMVGNLFRKWEYQIPRWHHRLWDVSAYAAGVLGLDELPGLAKVCELLAIEPGDHSAEADVTATGLCFRELQRRAS